MSKKSLKEQINTLSFEINAINNIYNDKVNYLLKEIIKLNQEIKELKKGKK